ncbi:hypothetical protein SAMN06265347_10787 [Halobellus salinus]|nr:hypothetical protein SAMN06265347_10787 [Halobellus salinus]
MTDTDPTVAVEPRHATGDGAAAEQHGRATNNGRSPTGQ